MLGLDRVQELQPVELGALQPDVEKHQVRPARLDRSDRLVAVARGARIVALVLQDARHQLADVGLVVDDEDVGRHRYALAGVVMGGAGAADLSSAGVIASAAKRRRTQAPRAPGVLSAASRSSMRPPWSSRILPTIASPSPVPFSRVVT